MKYICFSAILVLFTLHAFPQEFNKKTMDEKTGTEILIGYCNESALQLGEFGQSYNLEYQAYRPGIDELNKLKYKLDDITFTVVLGTWCGDSKEQVGRFTKLLYCLKYDINRVSFIAVDREKKAGDIDISTLDISKVPTVIVFRDGKEIGRIVETPTKTFEADLVGILNL